MSVQHQIIEHIVLLKVNPDVDSTKVAAMIDELNGLASLNLTIHLSTGELLRSTSSSLSFTHLFHSRFRSADDLQIYNDHPQHLRLITEIIQPIIEDFVIVDWISNGICDSPKPGSAMRVTLLKLKEDLIENEKSKLVDRVIEGMKNRFKASEQISFGENFSHTMSKGYSIAMIAVFPGSVDLETIFSDADFVNETKVTDLIESELVVDYLFPLPKIANH